jgi:hypothetical protein
MKTFIKSNAKFFNAFIKFIQAAIRMKNEWFFFSENIKMQSEWNSKAIKNKIWFLIF